MCHFLPLSRLLAMTRVCLRYLQSPRYYPTSEGGFARILGLLSSGLRCGLWTVSAYNLEIPPNESVSLPISLSLSFPSPI